MKKLYIFAVVLLMAGGLVAQTTNLPIGPNIKLHRPLNIPPKPTLNPGPEAVAAFIIDYDSADAYSWWTGGDTYDRYIWDNNWNYNAALGDTSLKYIVTTFDTIIDTYASPIPMGYPPAAIQQVRVDSIYIVMGQENNSTFDDTLIVKLMNVNANGYPSTTIYWADTLYFPTDIPHGTNWLQAYYVSIPVGTGGFTIPSNGSKFQVRLEYHGNKLDTMGVIAGFGSLIAQCGTNPSALIAYQTVTGRYKLTGNNWYNANSYALWTQYASYGILPTSGAANLYYDCDNSGGITPGDGANYTQNWNILSSVTITHNLGMDEDFKNGMKLGQNFPNPAVNEFNIIYELNHKANVTVEIMDMTGKVVGRVVEGIKTTGTHTIKLSSLNLQAGTYFYTLTTDGNKLTKKMSIAK